MTLHNSTFYSLTELPSIVDAAAWREIYVLPHSGTLIGPGPRRKLHEIPHERGSLARAGERQRPINRAIHLHSFKAAAMLGHDIVMNEALSVGNDGGGMGTGTTTTGPVITGRDGGADASSSVSENQS